MGKVIRWGGHHTSTHHIKAERGSEMTNKLVLPIKLLRKLLVCDADKGLLLWKERTPDLFKSDKRNTCASWNTRMAGKTAFISLDTTGYLTGNIFNRAYRAHRVIWAMHYGEWPNYIDHKDHDRANNRISNLRSGSQQDNCRNRSLVKNNTSGICGVCWHSKAEKWQAQITVNGKSIYLGLFEDIEDAGIARGRASDKYGFRKTHGDLI